MKIYVLFGSSGSYDDWRDWPVHAYEDETEAGLAALRLNERISRLRHDLPFTLERDRESLHAKAVADIQKYDPVTNCIDEDSSYYTVQELELTPANTI